jgi:hypothetical protein
MRTPEVISAFLDDEPFEPSDLAAALADPEGRRLLLDLVALRTLVRSDPFDTPTRLAPVAISRPKWIAVGFLAASVVFGAGAAWLLPPRLRQPADDVPPTPTHVITFDTGPSVP